MVKPVLLAWVLLRLLAVPEMEAAGGVAQRHGIEQLLNLKQEESEKEQKKEPKLREVPAYVPAESWKEEADGLPLCPAEEEAEWNVLIIVKRGDDAFKDHVNEKDFEPNHPRFDAYMDPVMEKDLESPEKDDLHFKEELRTSLVQLERQRRLAGMRCTVKAEGSEYMEIMDRSWTPGSETSSKPLQDGVAVTQTKPMRRLRRRRRPSNVIAFDPSSKECYEGHCLYASLAEARYARCTPRRMMMIRKLIAEAWRCPTQQGWLTELSKMEQMTSDEYIRTYVTSGWGGTPELAQYARTSGVTIRVWGERLQKLEEIKAVNATEKIDLYYAKEHYCLMKAQAGEYLEERAERKSTIKWVSARRGGGRRREESRSRSRSKPRLILRSREEVQAREQPPMRDAPDCEKYEEESRKRKEAKQERKRQREQAKQQAQLADREDPPAQRSEEARSAEVKQQTEQRKAKQQKEGKMDQPKTPVHGDCCHHSHGKHWIWR